MHSQTNTHTLLTAKSRREKKCVEVACKEDAGAADLRQFVPDKID